MSKTVERPLYLDKLDPIDAAGRVGEFIGTPQRSGPWTIKPFTVDRQAASVDYLRSLGDGGGRWTPPGDYIMLTHDDPEIGPMMSNTPDEMQDHSDAIRSACGRVLVSGLGLSCVISGLLANEEVEHVDVIELDEDVIRLIGPAYINDPRVTIHHGNVLTYEWPDDERWDFAWHDIWAKISSDNLEPETAENGVSYRGVFERYAGRVWRQNAWAFSLAVMMEECYRRADERAQELAQRWVGMTEDERIDLIISFQSENPITKALAGENEDTSVQAMRLLYESNPSMMERVRKAAKSKFSPAFMPNPQMFREEVIPDLSELVAKKADEFGFDTINTSVEAE